MTPLQDKFMTPIQKIDLWLDDIKKDMDGKHIAGYATESIYDKLRDLKESLQMDAMKATAIPPHPIGFHTKETPKQMPIRDQIACMAMSGMLSNPNNVQGNLNPEYLAEASYDYATAMIKEGNIQT